MACWALCTAVFALALGAAASAPAAAADAALSPLPTIAAPDGPGGRFGDTVALSGDGATALIGAPFDGTTGRVWFYSRTLTEWVTDGPPFAGTESPNLCEGEEPVEPEPCRFGLAVALSGDGQIALVGIPDSDHYKGVVWVFTRSGSGWTRGPELRPADASSDAHFGRSVALSADGSTALIGGPGDNRSSGAAWVFTRSGSTWTQAGSKLTSGEDVDGARFGRSVALSADGATALIGAPHEEAPTGAAWVFAHTAEGWEPQGPKLTSAAPTPGEGFGHSVALSADGTTALIGAPYHAASLGAAWVFTPSGSVWSEQGPALVPVGASGASLFGVSVALSARGDVALVGGSGDEKRTGAAWEFGRSGTVWSPALETAPTEEATDHAHFGTAVAMSSDGSTALAGAPFFGSEAGGVWSLADPLTEALPVETPPVETPPIEEPHEEPPPGRTETTTTPRSDLAVLGTSSESPPSPVLDSTGDVEPTGGTVLVRIPGSGKFVALTGLRNVPFGTVIDARQGRVTVTTVGPDGKPQQITFYAGMFELLSRGHGRVVAVLSGGSYAACPTARQRAHSASVATSRHHTVRKLWASGHGSYSTKGSYAAGAVQGTRWLTEDRCDGTLIVVATDRVLVTNLVTGRHRIVRAHHRYFAPAP